MSIKWKRATAVAVGCFTACLLVACSGEAPAKLLTPEQQELADIVKARQANLRDLGAAFKAVSDEMKEGRPASPTVEFSVKAVAGYAPKLRNWFPAGSGPELGVKTGAAETIWSDPAGFEAELIRFEEAVAVFNAERGDADRLAANFKIVGGTCKSCHDTYRIEE